MTPSDADPKYVISRWHTRTLDMRDDQKVKITASELRSLLWALIRALELAGQNARNIDYNLGEIAKFKKAAGLSVREEGVVHRSPPEPSRGSAPLRDGHGPGYGYSDEPAGPQLVLDLTRLSPEKMRHLDDFLARYFGGPGTRDDTIRFLRKFEEEGFVVVEKEPE